MQTNAKKIRDAYKKEFAGDDSSLKWFGITAKELVARFKKEGQALPSTLCGHPVSYAMSGKGASHKVTRWLGLSLAFETLQKAKKDRNCSIARVVASSLGLCGMVILNWAVWGPLGSMICPHAHSEHTSIPTSGGFSSSGGSSSGGVLSGVS